MHVGNDVHILRPSLYAMSRIGSPAYIVEVCAVLLTGGLTGKAALIQKGYAIDVLTACCDNDISEITGYYEYGDNFVQRLMDDTAIITLARCLIQHGVIGVNKVIPKSIDAEDDYVQEFDAKAHVAAAIAHLGMSEKDAWNMTMTGLVEALRSKFPPSAKDSPGQNAPSKADHEAAMEWFDAIKAKREARANRAKD